MTSSPATSAKNRWGVSLHSTSIRAGTAASPSAALGEARPGSASASSPAADPTPTRRTSPVEIDISTRTVGVRARGPRTNGREGWSVDVEVETPRDLPLTLVTANGGIDIQDVTGRTRFETVNGGVSLSNVSGDVRGRTVNGGLNVRLDGPRWEGPGLELRRQTVVCA